MSPTNGRSGAAVLEPEVDRTRRKSGRTSAARSLRRRRVNRFLRENGLSIAAFGLFLVCLLGQVLTGVREYNADQREHGRPEVGIVEYLLSGHFFEATFENWESEFLQMAAFVVLTVSLRQKGSPESKKLTGEEEVDEDPRDARRTAHRRAKAPWPVRRGGVALALYEHSLSIALLLLFAASFVVHAIGGVAEYNEDQLAHGGEAVSTLAYLATARFWFESFQNWQSEFLSVGALFVLTIFLRERGSPQSKPVAAPHDENE
jgi:hypothetical protein